MTCFLTCEKSVEVLFQVLKKFQSCSGLKVNTEKTEGVWLGPWKGRGELKFGVRWPTTPVKIVGVYFAYNQREVEILNSRTALNKMKSVINTWKTRKLSLFVKVH